ncbi:DUF6538 domain-containing protein [Tritonibacter mobilis]|uniref:DUF6538 domain-containing protein n=1 Tax=Tritonibacter mobilis TaxID=379347 RepID=UPI003A5C031A
MRVPKRFHAVEDRKEIFASLKTGDLLKAEARAAELEQRLIAMWEARLAGENPDFQSIVRYCQTLGFAYKPFDQQSDAEFLARMIEVRPQEREHARALLGTVQGDDLRVSKMPEVYEGISAYRLALKNPEQMRMWRGTFKRAAAEFVAICGDLKMSQITDAEALRFKEHFRARVVAGNLLANSANRSLGAIGTMFKEINADRKMGLGKPFDGIRLKEGRKQRGRRKALPEAAIQKMLAPGALDGMNDEARDILHICINTGCRPSEVCCVLPHQMHLSAEVPHFELLEEGRELKTGASIRKVVLIGIALEAMVRRFEAGGFPRYNGKNNSMTSAINKFLRENGFLEEGYSFYGVRHSFQDRVTSRNLTERISAELMGHEVRRERYGDGPDLKLLADALSPISYY